MEEQNKRTSYGNVLKTTFMFGFVQIFNILVKVGLNKAVALLIGPAGLGTISIYQNTINLLKCGCGIGVSQSAVKDISEAYATEDNMKLSRNIKITSYVIYCLSILGIIVTVSLSGFLSKWTFGLGDYTIAYVFLALAVAFNIFSDSQFAILKGMRRMKILAVAMMLGSLFGLIFAVPLYYYFHEKGIVPSLLVSSFVAVLFSNYFVRKVKIENVKLSYKEFISGASPMLKMGASLMIASFVITAFDLIVSAFIRSEGGLSDVGFYQAGSTIITGYFGIITTAMATDYYPRVAAVNGDNKQLEIELNRQSEIGLILIFPLAVLFTSVTPLILHFLYSQEFSIAAQYSDIAIFGMIIIVISNCSGYILLAKQDSKIYLVSIIFERLLNLLSYILLYRYLGLLGLGIAYALLGIIDLTTQYFLMKHFYGIKYQVKVLRLLILIITVVAFSVYLRTIDWILVRYVCSAFVLFFSVILSGCYLKRYCDIDIVNIIKNKTKSK